MEPFILAKDPIRAGNKNTSHNSAEILRGFGILSPESKGGDWTRTNSKALLKKNQCILCAEADSQWVIAGLGDREGAEAANTHLQ